MNPTNPSISSYLDKNFWNRGEGVFSKWLIRIGGLGAAVGIALNLGPALLWLKVITGLMLATTVNLVLTGAIIFAVVYALSDAKFRGLFGFAYRTLIRKLWSIAVDMSPKAILDDIVEGLRQNFVRLEKNVKSFRARVRATQEKISSNEEAMNNALRLAQEAKKQNKAPESILHAREAERYRAFNAKLKAIYLKMEVILRVLLKMKDGAEFSLRDTENRVKMELMEHAALMDAAMAVDEAVKIIKGDAHKNELFNAAMEKLANEKAGALSELEDFMETSERFFSSVDLEKAIADENAMKLLEEWESKVDSMILGPGVKQDILNSASNPNNVLSLDEDGGSIPIRNEPKRVRVGGGRSYFND